MLTDQRARSLNPAGRCAGCFPEPVTAAVMPRADTEIPYFLRRAAATTGDKPDAETPLAAGPMIRVSPPAAYSNPDRPYRRMYPQSPRDLEVIEQLIRADLTQQQKDDIKDLCLIWDHDSAKWTADPTARERHNVSAVFGRPDAGISG
jgi:hypothetical protein